MKVDPPSGICGVPLEVIREGLPPLEAAISRLRASEAQLRSGASVTDADTVSEMVRPLDELRRALARALRVEGSS